MTPKTVKTIRVIAINIGTHTIAIGVIEDDRRASFFMALRLRDVN
jgi:hypothetical protein